MLYYYVDNVARVLYFLLNIIQIHFQHDNVRKKALKELF